jgi:hypothetical protein
MNSIDEQSLAEGRRVWGMYAAILALGVVVSVVASVQAGVAVAGLGVLAFFVWADHR